MTSLRARKKRQTAEDLAGAAYALACQAGFEAVTTDEIATTAGVSRRTFANYYANKHAAVVDGFMQQLGISTWRPDDPAGPEALPETFAELVDSTHTFISDVFTSPEKIAQIQQFAQMLKENPALEPYVHAVFLEFQHSDSHRVLAERFGQVKVSIYVGAVIGSLGGIIRLILGPLAIHRDTPPLRGVSHETGADLAADTDIPALNTQDIEAILGHLDQAFTYLRHGFVTD